MPATLAIAAVLLTATALTDANSPQPVAAGVTLLRGAFEPGQQPDGNSVLFEGPRGVLVVDTGRHPAHTARIAAAVRATGKPLVAIVNTHWHLDHVSGNPSLRESWPRAQVYASGAIRPALEGFLARYRRSLLAMLDDGSIDADAKAGFREEIARIDAGPALLPDRQVDHARTLRVGGLRLDLHSADFAATSRDLWLFDPLHRVLVAGDLVTLPAPFLDTACPAGWQRALAALEAQPFQVLVPGHGGPFDRAQFVAWRAAFDALLDCAATDAEVAVCSAAWVEATQDLPGAGAPGFARELADYYVSQRLRGPARTADCNQTKSGEPRPS